MTDARTVIARAEALLAAKDLTFAECSLAEEWERTMRDLLTAARLAVVPVPEGDVVEAVENVMLRYDADMKLGGNADACRDDLVALIAAEREACAKTLIALAEREGFLSAEQIEAAIRAGGRRDV